jgi:hypothetical protein
MKLSQKIRLWNKGGFGFWIVGLNYMRKRDAVMQRLLIKGAEVRFARTHEKHANPRFADTEILDFRTNARKENK